MNSIFLLIFSRIRFWESHKPNSVASFALSRISLSHTRFAFLESNFCSRSCTSAFTMELKDDIEIEELDPRNYQQHLVQIVLKKNTIIYLPTGAGKTLIAILVIKQMSGDLQRSYGEGGKVSIFLVNTVALVDQHVKTLKLRTPFSVGGYSGDMVVDNYTRADWEKELNNNQILVMTTQILVNMFNSSYIDLNKVNILVFDECHRGVKDQPMRQIMRSFQNLVQPPRVLGLTATLLNGNCKSEKVREEIHELEKTYHAQVATVEFASDVIPYATNPTELLEFYYLPEEFSASSKALQNLADLIQILECVVLEQRSVAQQNDRTLIPMYEEKGLKELINVLKDAQMHIRVLGLYGGLKAVITYMIFMEVLKKNCSEIKMNDIFNFVLTCLGEIKKDFENVMEPYSEREKIIKFSSDQIHRLLKILSKFRNNTDNLELCSIIFVERRFTAKILYHVLTEVIKLPEYDFIKPQFIVGYNNNPYNETREAMYIAKQNRKIVSDFYAKKINLIVSTNVLEEGVDIPNCSLIVKFDKPVDYRSYVQSKGRARHKSGLYYIMVPIDKKAAFIKIYGQYKIIEEIIAQYLIGQNDTRSEPSKDDIKDLYDENVIPPYEPNGPGGARVDLCSSVSLLCQYCQTLPGDKYTQYVPDWYIRKRRSGQLQVVIELPIKCPIRRPIEGPLMETKKMAKRAAALIACIELHKIGELDDDLKPRARGLEEVNTDYLFREWPAVKEPGAGNKNFLRTHLEKVPDVLKGSIKPGNPRGHPIFVHTIDIVPRFKANNDHNLGVVIEMYESELCYGLITSKPLPELCEFPLYVSGGQIDVTLKVNRSSEILNDAQVYKIRAFHTLVFRDVLTVLKEFLIFDNSEDAESLIVVPIDKNSGSINFNALEGHKINTTLPIKELTTDEKLNLKVTDELFLKRIVTPTYRPTISHYIVTMICTHLNANSPFPQPEFATFVDYYSEKYRRPILNRALPLLLVKGLSKRLNCLKPRGLSKKRRKDDLYEEIDEHHIPELCVRQEFPASLWIQASLLPSILHRVCYLFKADELRSTIVSETKIGSGKLPKGEKWLPLVADPHVSKNEPQERYEAKEDDMELTSDMAAEVSDILSGDNLFPDLNKDFASKILESKYPWKDTDEPIDIERNLDVCVLDVEHYVAFVSATVTHHQRMLKNVDTKMTDMFAITYNETFEHKELKLLKERGDSLGPQLRDIYKALATKKSFDIVNCERLETLGDSFLKFCVSLFITLKYPEFDEGQCSALKGKMVSNKNLFYKARMREIGGAIIDKDLKPSSEWLVPSFTVARILRDSILERKVSIGSLYSLYFDHEEQVSGTLKPEHESSIANILYAEDVSTEEDGFMNSSGYLKAKYIGDKFVADSVEALLGVFFESNGFDGGFKFVEWLHIIPPSENIKQLLNRPPPNPILNPRSKPEDILCHLPTYRKVEERLGYQFNDRAYLLQALTHSSYTGNRITDSYERLEFLGDAVLDFLVTCYIYEHCGNLDPGEITDLRSALVNNCTFASFTIRCGFHKFLLSVNNELAQNIDRYAEFQENRQYVIDEQVLILLQEDDMNLAEHVDIPKVLGDVFEAMAGAVYLDSGKNLETVWKVFYKIMWREIKSFSENVPKNPVRQLFEKEGAHPHFFPAKDVPNNGKTMVKVEFMLNGARKWVHGFGDNKKLAKKAAAKIALRLLTAGQG